MFSIENRQLYITGLYDIVANYCSLLNDGDNEILYIGTNKYCSNILGSILYEDDEKLYLRYIHSLISDETLHDFLSKKISLRDIITNSNSVFIVEKNYNNETINSALIPIQDLPDDCLPLKNSFLPNFIKLNTLDYKFSLKGDLADFHKADPLIMSATNIKIYNLLSSATNFLNDLGINPIIYSEVALAGSFELNFEIELKEQLNLFTKSTDDLKNFLYNFFNYIFEKLPNEPLSALKSEDGITEDLRLLFNEVNEIYNNRDISINYEATEQKVIDLITSSVDSVKDIEYKGYDRIEVGNKLKNGQMLPVALIKTDYYNSVVDKVFKPEHDKKIILIDEVPKSYKLQVYSLNTESGNCGAYYIYNDSIKKIQLHLRGLNDYHGTIFTKSLDENISIEVKGIGKWENDNLKEVVVNL